MTARIHNINEAKIKIYKERAEGLECDLDHCLDQFSKAMRTGTPEETHMLAELANELDKEIHDTNFKIIQIEAEG